MDSNWIRRILACPRCNQAEISFRDEGAVCKECGFHVSEEDGVFDLLVNPHPVLQREQEAIARSDAKDPEYDSRMDELLQAIDHGEEFDLEGHEAMAYACIAHVAEARRKVIGLLERYVQMADGVLLELGSDHCWASGLFIDRGYKVIASDITDHLRHAQRSGDPNLFRMKADMNRMPLRDESVDIVWGTSVAHHSWDLGLTFSEAARILKPGGKLVFCCEPMPSWLRYALFGFGLFFGRKLRQQGINERLRPRSRWISLCREAGLVPRLIFPHLSPDEIKAKLANRRLPMFLGHMIAPLIRMLQVSIHLVARKSC